MNPLCYEYLSLPDTATKGRFFNSFNRDAIKPPEPGEQPSFDPSPGRERGWELLAVLRLKGAELEQPLGWPWV